MSDTVQAPGPTPVTQRDEAGLGLPPLLVSFLLLLGVGLGGLLFLVVAATSGQGGGILALVLFIPWLVVTSVFAMGFLRLLFGAGQLTFSRTAAAVRDGRIGVSYYARSWLGDGIIVVDEPRRLLCINGEVIGFDSVRKVGWESGGNRTDKLEIVLTSGAHPVRTVNMHSEARMKEAFERLCNTLGFTG